MSSAETCRRFKKDWEEQEGACAVEGGDRAKLLKIPKGKVALGLSPSLPVPHPRATPTRPEEASHIPQAPPPPQEAQPSSSCVTLGKSLTRVTPIWRGYYGDLKR